MSFDTEDDLVLIARNIPATTRIVAGGPAFKGDPEFARRTGVHRVASDPADFLKCLCDYSRSQAEGIRKARLPCFG